MDRDTAKFKVRKKLDTIVLISNYRAAKALMEMYLAGVSVRRVEDITEALWERRMSTGPGDNFNVVYLEDG
jgi:hypothetical protein